jgi:hypothetical protein
MMKELPSLDSGGGLERVGLDRKSHLSDFLIFY